MINLLYPTLPFGDDETPTSFLSRLARLHRSGTARMLAYDLGLNARKIVEGDHIMLGRLAALSGVSAKALIHNDHLSVGDQAVMYKKLDRLAGQLVQLENGALNQMNQILNHHGSAAQHNLNL